MRWSGKLGYTREEKVRPGVVENVSREVSAIGDVVQTTDVLRGDEGVLGSAVTTTSISIVGTGLRFSPEEIKYITWRGNKWQIASIVHQYPRLVIYLGEVYRGPSPEPAPDDI